MEKDRAIYNGRFIYGWLVQNRRNGEVKSFIYNEGELTPVDLSTVNRNTYAQDIEGKFIYIGDIIHLISTVTGKESPADYIVKDCLDHFEVADTRTGVSLFIMGTLQGRCYKYRITGNKYGIHSKA